MAQVNPQLMAMLAAMASNPNADQRGGGPVLGGHPGMQTVNNGNGAVGGDGEDPYAGRYAGLWPAPGETHEPSAEHPEIPSGFPDDGEYGQGVNQNHQSLLGPHGTNAAGILANLSAILSPGQYNTRHPLTLMKQINPGLISQPSKSGGGFGVVDQQATQKQNVLAQLLAQG